MRMNSHVLLPSRTASQVRKAVPLVRGVLKVQYEPSLSHAQHPVFVFCFDEYTIWRRSYGKKARNTREESMRIYGVSTGDVIQQTWKSQLLGKIRPTGRDAICGSTFILFFLVCFETKSYNFRRKFFKIMPRYNI